MSIFKCGVLLCILFLCLFSQELTYTTAGWVGRALYDLAAFCANATTQWMVLSCLFIWCCVFSFPGFKFADLALVVLLLMAAIGAVVCPSLDTVIFVFTITLGKAVGFAFKSRKLGEAKISEFGKERLGYSFERKHFLIGLVLFLLFASYWKLNGPYNSYHGPRWAGLWDNPNEYGILMGVGLIVASALIVETRTAEMKKQKLLGGWQTLLLSAAAVMMTVGLLLSYSRGAWLGAGIGLLFLTIKYEKLKWRYILALAAIVAAILWLFWDSTPDTAPWYVKRLDFSRPSAQHRVAAWKAGFEIIFAHPCGVGWNKTVEVYQQGYSPPENGAAAITTNDYLMLGTQLGILGLLCFLAYVYLAFKPQTVDPAQIACRAGTLSMLVAFWFDDGLFRLATASVFWVLLELGAVSLSKTSKNKGRI